MASVAFNPKEIIHSFSVPVENSKKSTCSSAVAIMCVTLFLSIAAFACYAKLSQYSMQTERIKSLSAGCLIAGISLLCISGIMAIIYVRRDGDKEKTYHILAEDLSRLMNSGEAFEVNQKFYCKQGVSLNCYNKHPSQLQGADECKFSEDLVIGHLERRFLA